MIICRALEAEVATPSVTIPSRMVRGVFLAACCCLWESWPVYRPQDVLCSFPVIVFRWKIPPPPRRLDPLLTPLESRQLVAGE